MEQMSTNWNLQSHILHLSSHALPHLHSHVPSTPTFGFQKKRSQEKVFVSGIKWKMESNFQNVYGVNILLHFLWHFLSLQ